jgi:hypothetical protein
MWKFIFKHSCPPPNVLFFLFDFKFQYSQSNNVCIFLFSLYCLHSLFSGENLNWQFTYQEFYVDWEREIKRNISKHFSFISLMMFYMCALFQNSCAIRHIWVSCFYWAPLAIALVYTWYGDGRVVSGIHQHRLKWSEVWWTVHFVLNIFVISECKTVTCCMTKYQNLFIYNIHWYIT